MRVSTVLCLVAAVLAGAILVYSARQVDAPATVDGRRLYRLACWGNAQEIRQLQELVVDPINARPGRYHLSLLPIPSDYTTKLSTMIAGDAAPELFYLSQEHVPAFAAQGAVMDLTEHLARGRKGPTDLADYYPSVLERYRYRGRLYGLPWIAQPVILYCNVALFRAAGVALPDASWDWRRFVEAAGKLTRDTDGDGRIDQWGFILNGWPPYQIWVWQNGGEVISPATGRLQLTDPRVLEAIEFYAGLIHRWHVAPPLSVVGEAGFSDLFRAGKVAMFMGGAADDLDRLEGLEVVAAELPAGPTGIRATFAWTAGLHISPAVADPGEAFALYKQVLDGIQHWKVPAPRRSLAGRLARIEPRKAPAARVILASMAYMRTPAAFPRQVEFDTLFWEEFEDKLLRGEAPAGELAGPAMKVLEKLR